MDFLWLAMQCNDDGDEEDTGHVCGSNGDTRSGQNDTGNGSRDETSSLKL